MNCLLCGKELTGLQKKFCCRAHMLKYNNANMQCYANQRARADARKKKYIAILGGKCSICGYDRNIAALEFHHKDPASKLFQLDGRHLANTKPAKVEEEIKKCILVCSNCHRELHHPEFTVESGTLTN
jgi:predicted HNH restriction endonuclease